MTKKPAFFHSVFKFLRGEGTKFLGKLSSQAQMSTSPCSWDMMYKALSGSSPVTSNMGALSSRDKCRLVLAAPPGAPVTWAMTSGSIGRWLLKLFDLPAVTVFRICGLSSRFFRDEWRLMELRLPCPLMEHLSGPSLGRLWLMMGWEDGRQPAPTPEEAESVREPLSPWLSLRKVFRMLPDSGRFLCLQSQRERAV